LWLHPFRSRQHEVEGRIRGQWPRLRGIDSEHGSRDRTEIQTLCAMFREIDIMPIVRVPAPMSHYVAMALDAGAAGILVPYCETVEEVAETVGTAHWHPLKGEYLRQATQGVFPSPRTKEYLENRRRESFVIIGIESEPGQRNLDKILEVPGIDAIFIGPNDMTTSLGIPDEYTNQKYLDVIKDIVTRSEAKGVPVQVFTTTPEEGVNAVNLGARLVFHTGEARFMQTGMREEFGPIRAAAAARGNVEGRGH
ncbi:MAG: aldolase/citrate lyase family protein, partial [Chloroflexota bacterium]